MPDSGAGTDPGANMEPTPLWAKLGNIIARRSLRRDRALPVVTANWLVPTLLVIVAGWVGLWLVFQQDSIDQQIRDMQEQRIQKLGQTGKMSQQQADATVEKFGWAAWSDPASRRCRCCGGACSVTLAAS